MSQHILTVAGTEMQPTYNFEQFRLQAMDVGLHRGPLARFTHNSLDLLLCFGNHLFNAGRVDAPIENELGQSQASYFTTHRIETGENNRLRRVIDDQVNAGGGLKCANIAPLTSDDTPLHFVVGQRHHRDNRLGNLVGCAALNGEGDDFSCATLGLFARLFFNQTDALCGLGAHLIFNTAQQEFTGLLLRKLGDTFYLAELLAPEILYLFLRLLQATFSQHKLALALFKRIKFSLKRLFFLLDTPFLALYLSSPLSVFTFHSCAKASCFITSLKKSLALLRLGFQHFALIGILLGK